MTYLDLLQKLDDKGSHPFEFLRHNTEGQKDIQEIYKALQAVIELHQDEGGDCKHCYGSHDMGETYPCPTIQAIEKELK